MWEELRNGRVQRSSSVDAGEEEIYYDGQNYRKSDFDALDKYLRSQVLVEDRGREEEKGRRDFEGKLSAGLLQDSLVQYMSSRSSPTSRQWTKEETHVEADAEWGRRKENERPKTETGSRLEQLQDELRKELALERKRSAKSRPIVSKLPWERKEEAARPPPAPSSSSAAASTYNQEQRRCKSTSVSSSPAPSPSYLSEDATKSRPLPPAPAVDGLQAVTSTQLKTKGSDEAKAYAEKRRAQIERAKRLREERRRQKELRSGEESKTSAPPSVSQPRASPSFNPTSHGTSTSNSQPSSHSLSARDEGANLSLLKKKLRSRDGSRSAERRKENTYEEQLALNQTRMKQKVEEEGENETYYKPAFGNRKMRPNSGAMKKSTHTRTHISGEDRGGTSVHPPQDSYSSTSFKENTPPQGHSSVPASSASAFVYEYPSMEEQEEAAAQELVPCSICGRRFALDRVGKHETVCRRNEQNKVKRKVFDSTSARVAGTEAQKFVSSQKAGGRGAGKKRESGMDKITSKPSKWKQQRAEFLAAIRSVRGGDSTGAASKGGSKGRSKGGSIEPEEFQPVDNRVPCPHCGRKFSEDAAERHIPICAKLNRRMDRRSNNSSTTRGRGTYRTTVKQRKK